MFDEVCLRADLECKILPGQLIVGRFGLRQTCSVIAISQTLDKLVVHNFPSNLINDANQYKFGADNDLANYYYISVKDIIKTISVKSFKRSSLIDFKHRDENLFVGENANAESKAKGIGVEDTNESIKSFVDRFEDLLLVGCASFILIYDVERQNCLQSIIMPIAINVMTGERSNSFDKRQSKFNEIFPNLMDDLIVCAGLQKIYTLKFEFPSSVDFSKDNVNAEISSGRSTSDMINCLTQGRLDGMEFVITGSIECKICIYQLDSIDQNISTCKLSIEESSQINCLCPINTISESGNTKQADIQMPSNTEERSKLLLPSVISSDTEHIFTGNLRHNESLHTNYFAFGLENGFIGVHRLINIEGTSPNGGARLLSERLWRHKSKYTPLVVMMFDIDGDGFDELIIGYKNSRIEARSPFTGQLLATTRCFKSDRLVGLSLIDEQSSEGNSLILLACSTSGSLVGFKPRFSRPWSPLQGYNLPSSSSEIAPTTAATVKGNPIAGLMYNTQNWLAPANGMQQVTNNEDATKLRTIEQQQDCKDIFMNEATSYADLHIETKSDDTKPTKCDAKQSLDLLQRINILYCEQMELEKKACYIYNKNVNQSSKLYPSDVNIAYKWDFDYEIVHLRLTILVHTSVELVKLVKLEDESRNVLTNGYLFVIPFLEKTKAEEGFRHEIVLALRAKKNLASKLKLKVFCESGKESSGLKVSKVYNKSINVPVYSMFAFAPKSFNDATAKTIRMVFPLCDNTKISQVLNWINENFLCFQFAHTEESENQWQQSDLQQKLSQQTQNSLKTSSIQFNSDTGDFDLKLIDIRFTLERMKKEKKKPDEEDPEDDFSGGEGKFESFEVEEEEREMSGACKFKRLGSTLRIGVANGALKLESESSGLIVDLVQSLMIDRLHLEPASDKLGEVVRDVEPLLDELDMVTKNCRQLEESERRIQTELYESVEYTQNLMQQFTISNELNEFVTSKELLNEVSMMFAGSQNAARAHALNNRSRLELSKQINELKGKISFLSGHPV